MTDLNASSLEVLGIDHTDHSTSSNFVEEIFEESKFTRDMVIGVVDVQVD